MALLPGARLGPYEIQSPLGAGGMGEVYRARDTKLGRDVAVKVLLSEVANDADRLARFNREAQVLASLNHPHIAHVYGVEDAGDVHALVMELVEGPTLADRVAEGALSVRETLIIARQVADALAAAHEQGVIHRDLKPANIKVREDGTVKVLDFGLAKAVGPARGGGASDDRNPSNSPTLTAATQLGIILGTAAYMAPEQAAGRPIDHRSDLWAFGVVVLEMLTGRPAFTGETVSHVIASVLKSEPDWNSLPAETPATLRKLLRRCLEKDRKRRADSAADLRLDIEDMLSSPVSEPAAATIAPRGVSRLLIVAGLLSGAAVGAITTWVMMRSTPRPAPGPARFVIAPRPTQPIRISPFERSLAISPDGRLLAYTTPSGGTTGGAIVLRPIDRIETQVIAGVTNARLPTFSPDGRWIAFMEETALRKVAVAGGGAVTLCRVSGGPRGISWGDDNTIVFATTDPTSGLWQVSADGGEPTALTTPDTIQPQDHFFPSLLPDGRGVLFTITVPGKADSSSIAVLDPKTGRHKTLIPGGSQPEFLSSGHLVYAARGALHVVAFDRDSLEVRGGPVPVVEAVAMGTTGAAYYGVSPSGTLVYVPASTATQRTRSVGWVNRRGEQQRIDVPSRVFAGLRLAPDGRRLALEARDEESDIWIWEFARATFRKLTYGVNIESNPVWAPDSRHVIFASDREGPMNVYRLAVDGIGAVERLTMSDTPHFATSIARDGLTLFGVLDGPKTSFDVVALGLTRDASTSRSSGAPMSLQPLVQTTAIEHNAEISPNGRYLAYASNESGRFEVYVRPFPELGGGKWIVSTAGGFYPVWSSNGRELFYLDTSGSLVAVDVDTSAADFAWGKPVTLLTNQFALAPPSRPYDVSADGQRFVILMPAEGDSANTTASLVVVLNWVEELKTKIN